MPEHSLGVVFWPAVLLSLERVAYVWIARSPERFNALCAGACAGAATDPVVVVRRLFYLFKGVQIGVFVWWCLVWGDGAIRVDATAGVVALGALIVIVGQALNVAVFFRLGNAVFYGAEFGRPVPWITGFPFSIVRHPQYVGTVLSIWGAFAILRSPHADWWLLPALETVYYAIGAHFERAAGPVRRFDDVLTH